KIDYCCGASHSLSVACGLAGVPVQTALAELENLDSKSAGFSPDGATLGELAQHIVDRHHSFVRSETPRIRTLLDKISEKHGRLHPVFLEIRALFGALADELTAHMLKEERILFPYVQALGDPAAPQACCGSVETPIAVMTAEHENAGGILAKM